MTTNEKLALLRKRMKEEAIDLYYVPTADPHLSEYIAPCFQTRAWLSGFTGSAGQVLVTQEIAALWTDGRYFIQAANEISGSEFVLMKQATPGYPRLLEYMLEQLPEGGRMGVNGAQVSQQEMENIRSLLAEKKGTVVSDLTLVEDLWSDRPAVPSAKVFVLPERYTGQNAKAKLAAFRQHLAEAGQEAALLARLDDIAWLFNIRGGDIQHTPVAYAYALVTQAEALLFIDSAKVSEAIEAALAEEGIEIRPYDAVRRALADLEDKALTLDKHSVNSLVYQAIPESVRVLQATDWTTSQKAMKNETEIRNIREAFRKDGVAVTRLIYWLKHLADPAQVDELMVSQKLEEIHQALPDYLEPSFTTIAAYGPNAAMMHYAPTPERKAQLAGRSFLLVDSGGQYLEGTTDTTRTIALGPLTREEVQDYTLTLKGHMALATAVFMHGTNGAGLDMLARQPLWKHHMDYKSGTGHGIGYLLGVHEGPQSISPRGTTVALVPGMVVTNEPGVYKEGKHAIRLENVYVVVDRGFTDPDRFYGFENLTLVPFDREAIDPSMLTAEEIQWVDDYHQEVFEGLSGLLSEEESAWLQEVCRPL